MSKKMTENHEGWSTYCDRVFHEPLDFESPSDRLRAIDVVCEISDIFFAATVGALTPDTRRYRPSGGQIYDLDYWVRPLWFRDEWQLEYGDTFAAIWQPTDLEIRAFLAQRGLTLATPGTEWQVHRAWLGHAALVVAASVLVDLETPVVSERESLQWQAEFRRLAPLLEQRLDAGFIDTLIWTLYRLSKELALKQADRSRDPFLQAMFQLRGRWS